MIVALILKIEKTQHKRFTEMQIAYNVGQNKGHPLTACNRFTVLLLFKPAKLNIRFEDYFGNLSSKIFK